jgi:putative hydrolase of the HAD superfamily
VLRAVLFDVDFTLAKPGPDLGPEGYRRLGERFGLELDPARYDAARAAAVTELKRHPELDHDEQVWVAFTVEIVRHMGGEGEAARACAAEMVAAWEHSHNFELYEDVLPVLEELRRHRLRLGLVSNTSRDLEHFVSHHGLDVDAVVSSGRFGKTKPHPSIFEYVLDALEVAPADAAMVGDSVEDDIEGARALGMRAFLLDRDGRFPDADTRLTGLLELPAALGL